MNERKFTKQICERIWQAGGRIKSTRTNKHLVFHTTLSPKPLVFSKTPKSYARQSDVIDSQIKRHIKYHPA